jgi:hypothetical protein
MFMARSSERLSADAYTRASVEAYLQAAAEQRAKIELAIAEAEKRHEAALDALERLDGLQQSQATSTAVGPDDVDDDPREEDIGA